MKQNGIELVNGGRRRRTPRAATLTDMLDRAERSGVDFSESLLHLLRQRMVVGKSSPNGSVEVENDDIGVAHQHRNEDEIYSVWRQKGTVLGKKK